MKRSPHFLGVANEHLNCRALVFEDTRFNANALAFDLDKLPALFFIVFLIVNVLVVVYMSS